MSLQGIGKDSLTNFELKSFNKLLLLILGLLFAISRDAAFNDDVVIAMILALFLQSGTFNQLDCIQIT
jgi:hypothetical protein